MIRFLSAHALPLAVYAVECNGETYTPEEVARAIRAAASPSCSGPAACALCRTPITQPPRGRKRKYCDGCAARSRTSWHARLLRRP